MPNGSVNSSAIRNLGELLDWFSGQHHGARAYVELQRRALELARQDTTSVALFTLLAGVAHHIYRQLDGMPLDVDTARAIHDETVTVLRSSKERLEKSGELVPILNELARAQLGKGNLPMH